MFNWVRKWFRKEGVFFVGDHVTFDHDGKEETGVIQMIFHDHNEVEDIALVEAPDADGSLQERLFTFSVEDLELA